MLVFLVAFDRKYLFDILLVECNETMPRWPKTFSSIIAVVFCTVGSKTCYIWHFLWQTCSTSKNLGFQLLNASSETWNVLVVWKIFSEILMKCSECGYQPGQPEGYLKEFYRWKVMKQCFPLWWEGRRWQPPSKSLAVEAVETLVCLGVITLQDCFGGAGTRLGMVWG